jgi:predicted transposase YbfD/YdcC
VPAAPSSPIPTVLAKLGPLPPRAVDRLRVHLSAVPDPRSRRGRWYPLVSAGQRPADLRLRRSLGRPHDRRDHRHLLSTVTHAPSVTIAQREVDSKTTETAAFKLLLKDVDLTGTVVTFDALHSVKEQARWLAQDKNAHYIAVIKGNQPTAATQLKALPWSRVKVAHTRSETGHGRRESRSIKTLAVAASLGGNAFPEATLAVRIHRRRKETGRRESRETVYAVTSLDVHQAGPRELGDLVRGHRAVENASHHVRDRTFAEDASTVHTGNAPRAMAALRNLAIGALRLLGADNIAKTTRAIRDDPERAARILGISDTPHPSGT